MHPSPNRLALVALLAAAPLAMVPCDLAAQSLQPLQQYFNSRRGDNFATATQAGRDGATRAGYALVRTEACVYTAQQPGTVPLFQYYSGVRGDNFATTAVVGAKGAANPGGYSQVRIEGYVFSDPTKGTAPLNLYYNSQRQDNYTTATTAGAEAARAAGYNLVGIIGYVMLASNCQ